MTRSKNKKEKASQKNKNAKFGFGIVIIIIAIAVIYAMFAIMLVSPKSSFEVGEVAGQTIKAPREVEDKYTTDIARQEARNQVGPSYSKDPQITEQSIIRLKDALVAVDIVRRLGEDEYNRMKNAGDDIKFTVEFYEECLLELPEGFITGDIVSILQIGDEQEYIRLKETITDLIETEIENGVTESALESRRTDLKNQLILSGFDNEVRKLGSTLIDIFLKANMIFDAVTTADAKDTAESLVIPTLYKEGEIIVAEGAQLDIAQIKVLKTLGLVEDDIGGWIEYLAVGVISIILCIIIISYLQAFNKEVAYTNKMLSLTLVIIIATLLITILIRQIDVSVYFIPIAYAPLMLVMMIQDKRVAIFVNVLLSIMVGFLSIRIGESILLPIVTASFVAGTVSVFAVKNASQRWSILYAGFLSGVSMGIVYVAFDLINRVSYTTMAINFGIGITSGIVVAVLAIGTLPLVEATYKIVTPMRLMELTNPNQPLLKKLLIEAPGTYHHSIMVGNMAERAADAVGANALLVRTAAYYHDVGKSKRPYFFVENHADKRNPHDNIDSKASVGVITSHLSDGVDMLRRANIPPIVQEIVSQHHGDTAVMYFYGKDKEESSYPENIKIDNYRYKGERPKLKEAGILMLADSCEAAVRSLENATREAVEERIASVVKGKLDDGQLDYCDLTLKEISIIKEAFLVAVTGIFHERIEYPDNVTEE